MHVISRKALRAFVDSYPEARSALDDFFRRTESAHWRHFPEVKATFGQTDQARVASGNSVVVFDIGGNKWRVIAAIHYNTQSVFVLRVMTHDEYDANAWKRQL